MVGDFVELRVAGYQYDKSTFSTANGWDENWLTISGHVRQAAESWRFQNPCLTSWEARDLLSWLRSAVDSTPGPIEFTEPNLSFAVAADTGRPRMVIVTFTGEAARPSISEVNRGSSGCALSLDISPASLLDAAQTGESELTARPLR